ncbi:hypothetical protein V2K29_02070 [Pseudomonas alliivorans]|nr:hypothetical protein [Pseudomonas alliivorans]
MTDTKVLEVAKIIPGPQSSPNSPHLAQGTKVILSDGSELTGVTRITLRAEVGDVWKAIIEVYPREVPSITVEVTGRTAEDRCHATGDACLVTQGCATVPSDGTYLLERGERVK